MPFSVNHLLKFYDVLDLTIVKHFSAWCAMLVAFFGCFRLSNLVPASALEYDPLKHLSRDDVRFEDNVVLIYYKWSKTNQNCNRVSWVPICSVSDERFNVKLNLERLLSVYDAPKSYPLFLYDSFDGKKKLFHTRHSLVSFLDKCVIALNLSTADYSWHSFRRGSAVFAYELGLADSDVQLLGDWSSSAYKNYLEFVFKSKVSISETLARNFSNSIQNGEEHSEPE